MAGKTGVKRLLDLVGDDAEALELLTSVAELLARRRRRERGSRRKISTVQND